MEETYWSLARSWREHPVKTSQLFSWLAPSTSELIAEDQPDGLVPQGASLQNTWGFQAMLCRWTFTGPHSCCWGRMTMRQIVSLAHTYHFSWVFWWSSGVKSPLILEWMICVLCVVDYYFFYVSRENKCTLRSSGQDAKPGVWAPSFEPKPQK